jgi:hypothetical protein
MTAIRGAIPLSAPTSCKPKDPKFSIPLTTAHTPTSLSRGEDNASGSTERHRENRTPFESTSMTNHMSEQRKYVRYQAEFSATFEGDHAGMGIVYNLGMGGCKIVSDHAVKNGALLTIHLKVPKQTKAITIRAAAVQWIMELEFGVEFLEMQGPERDRLEQFLATQVNIAP